MNKRISIIMGIYNCQDTLRGAVDSILNQTIHDWELIMCDDGSNDNTYTVAEGIVKSHPESMILLKNKENKGLNYTLNRCLKYASGEYIARMDADDLCHITRLEKEITFLDSHPEFALVSTEMVMFDEQGIWGRTKAIEFPEKKDFCKHSPFFCHASSMIRKRVFDEVGGYTVDKKLLRVEDCHLWFKIYSKGYKGANILEPLYMMRDDRNATSRRNVKARLNGIYVMFLGYRMVKMPFYFYGYLVISVIRGIVQCIIPRTIYEYIHRKKLSYKNFEDNGL